MSLGPCVKPIGWWRTSFGEEEARRVAESLCRGHVSQGPVTAELERRLAAYLGVPYVVATTSGSTALLMALMAADVGPTDEVIVPNRTWIATAHAAQLLGAKVRLVEVLEDHPIMDVSRVERMITPRTKAIIPVHLNGRSVDMKELSRLADRYGVRIIEDAAQALGSRNAVGMLGCQSFAGCFSLGTTKIISTGQGGFVVTRDPSAFQRLKLMRTHGVGDFINTSYTQFGFNFRFTDIQASIGIVQLDRLSSRIEAVKAIYARYEQAMPTLPCLKFVPVDIDSGEVPVYVEVLCPSRAELVEFLAKLDIQTRPFYPDLNLAPHLASDGDFFRSRIFGQQGLFLPCGPEQSLEDVDCVVAALLGYCRQNCAA